MHNESVPASRYRRTPGSRAFRAEYPSPVVACWVVRPKRKDKPGRTWCANRFAILGFVIRRCIVSEAQTAEELLNLVRGLGAEHEPDEHARARAARFDGGLDLRGSRDRDPDAPHPWRSP